MKSMVKDLYVMVLMDFSETEVGIPEKVIVQSGDEITIIVHSCLDWSEYKMHGHITMINIKNNTIKVASMDPDIR